MRLPPNSVIATAKLTHYLLARRQDNDKSQWLAKAGYTAANWQQLEADLRDQVLSREAELDEENAYGLVYRIAAELIGPNGRQLRIMSIWMTEHQTGETKFITLYPQRGN